MYELKFWVHALPPKQNKLIIVSKMNEILNYWTVKIVYFTFTHFVENVF